MGIAIRLDIEGEEFAVLEALTSAGLLCSLSYLFVEFHHLHVNTTDRGLPAGEQLKERIHADMEQPGCRLRIFWRSLWASCGDEQRFMWRNGFTVGPMKKMAKSRKLRAAGDTRHRK